MKIVFARREMKIVFALFILLLMPSLVWAQQIPSKCVTTVAAGGTGDAIQLPQLPCWPTTTMVVLQINAPNLTSTPTISVNGSTPIRVVNFDGTPLTPDVFLPGQYRILTYNGSNWLVMTAGAENGLPYTGTVVYNGPLDGVTPADSAIVAAIASVPPGGTLVMPPGQPLLTSATQIPLNNITIQCQATPNASNAPLSGSGKIGTYGTTFLLTSTSGISVFGLKAGVTVSGCNFYWPNQNGVAVNPIVYPPLFSEVPGNPPENIHLENIHVINAYDFWDQNNINDTYGNIRLLNSDVYAIHNVWQLGNVQETLVVDNVVSNPSLFYDGAVSSPANLRNWTKLHGRWLHVFGNGGPVIGSTLGVGGIHTGQLTVVDYAIGVYVDPTGWLDKSSFGPNTTFDSDEQVLLVGPNGGGISRVTFGGRYYAFDTQGGTSNGGAFVINNPAHVDGSEDVSITGTLAGGNGSFFTCIGTNMNVINIHDTQIQNYGESTTTGPYYGVYVNCPNAYVTINGNTMFPGVVGSNLGIAILAAHSAVIGNNSILSAFDAMHLSRLYGSGRGHWEHRDQLAGHLFGALDLRSERCLRGQ